MGLKKSPLNGTKEPLLENRAKEYRYLIEGNYKISYSIEGSEVWVSSVFDCRQNPIKMIK